MSVPSAKDLHSTALSVQKVEPKLCRQNVLLGIKRCFEMGTEE